MYLSFQKISIPTLYTAKAANHAAAHCTKTNATAAKVEFISRFTAATAATQGVYSSEKTRKLTAVIGVNIPCKTAGSRSVEPAPDSTDNVDTTASFAEKPVIRAVDMRQSLKPRGANMGAIIFPTEARRL